MTELKPCPFCGGEAELRSEYSSDSGYWFRVDCNNKGCMGLTKRPSWDQVCSTGWRDIEQEAIEAWNTRAERTCKPEIENHGDLILTRYPCCGYELKVYRYSPYPEEAFNNCPNCGAKVVGHETQNVSDKLSAEGGERK